MSTPTPSTRWRCCAIIFTMLTSSISFTLAERRIFNAALNQRVTVSPRDATCGDGDTVTDSGNRRIRCLSGCQPERNASSLPRTDTRFPADVYQMGGDECHVLKNSYDELQPVMCYMFFKARYTDVYTYSVWFMPNETQTEQYVCKYCCKLDACYKRKSDSKLSGCITIVSCPHPSFPLSLFLSSYLHRFHSRSYTLTSTRLPSLLPSFLSPSFPPINKVHWLLYK